MKVFKNEKFREFLVGLTFCIICFMLTGIIGAGATSLISSREVSYKNNTSGMDSENVQDAIDELWISNGCTSSTPFKVGDLVQMSPTLSSYTTEPKYTGYDTPQTINPQELNLWRVIRVNEDGTYDAVSEYVSSQNVTFKGTKGYQSFVGYLNILASKYENRKYTVGSRIMGYNGQTEFITDTSYFDGTSMKASTEWTSSTSESLAGEYLGRGDKLYTIDYDLVKAVYGGTDSSYAKANKVGTATATSYWLGSRNYYYIRSADFNFNGRYVVTYGYINGNHLRNYYSGSWSGDNNSRALRPIITLRSGLTATGSGTSADPYVLQ